MTNSIDKVLTIKEVADRLGIKHSTLLSAIKKEQLKATFFHGSWKVRESSLRDYQTRHIDENDEFINLKHAALIANVDFSHILRAVTHEQLFTVKKKGSLGKVRMSELKEWMKDFSSSK